MLLRVCLALFATQTPHLNLEWGIPGFKWDLSGIPVEFIGTVRETCQVTISRVGVESSRFSTDYCADNERSGDIFLDGNQSTIVVVGAGC